MDQLQTEKLRVHISGEQGVVEEGVFFWNLYGQDENKHPGGLQRGGVFGKFLALATNKKMSIQEPCRRGGRGYFLDGEVEISIQEHHRRGKVFWWGWHFLENESQKCEVHPLCIGPMWLRKQQHMPISKSGIALNGLECRELS